VSQKKTGRSCERLLSHIDRIAVSTPFIPCRRRSVLTGLTRRVQTNREDAVLIIHAASGPRALTYISRCCNHIRDPACHPPQALCTGNLVEAAPTRRQLSTGDSVNASRAEISSPQCLLNPRHGACKYPATSHGFCPSELLACRHKKGVRGR
jgi:hypothetical protein